MITCGVHPVRRHPSRPCRVAGQVTLRILSGCGVSGLGVWGGERQARARQVLVKVLVIQWLHHFWTEVSEVHAAEVYRVTIWACKDKEWKNITIKLSKLITELRDIVSVSHSVIDWLNFEMTEPFSDFISHNMKKISQYYWNLFDWINDCT